MPTPRKGPTRLLFDGNIYIVIHFYYAKDKFCKISQSLYVLSIQMKDSPLVRTSTGTSFEASGATGDAVNLDITDVTFSAINATTAVTPSTTDAEMQINPVTIFQVRHFGDAAVVTDDIIEPMNVDHDYSYGKLPSDSVRTKTLEQMMHTM